MAMNKELSRVHANLEEELQRLEGTSEKLQVVESTKSALDSEDANDSDDVADLEEFLDLKELASFSGPCKGPIMAHTPSAISCCFKQKERVSFGKLHESTELAHDFEDPCDNLCCSLSKNPEKLKEQTVVLENSKPTAFSEKRKLNNSSFMGYHFGITPTFFVNADHLEIKITSGSCGPLNGKEICPEMRNSEPCDIVGTMEMFWIDMYFPFTNHSFEHPLALRMMCGYEVSEKLAFVITKWSGEFVSNGQGNIGYVERY
nr:hypothetical protein CFP56_62024 [Quercus suber]